MNSFNDFADLAVTCPLWLLVVVAVTVVFLCAVFHRRSYDLGVMHGISVTSEDYNKIFDDLIREGKLDQGDAISAMANSVRKMNNRRIQQR